MSDKHKPGMGFEVNIRRTNDKQPVANVDTDTPFCMAIPISRGVRPSKDDYSSG